MWWVPGDGEIQDRIGSIITAFEANLAGPFTIKIGETTAEGNRVALEAESHGALSNGLVYNNQYHFLFVIEGGKIALIKEYANSKHAHDVLGALFSEPVSVVRTFGTTCGLN